MVSHPYFLAGAMLLASVLCTNVRAEPNDVLETVTVWAQKREADLQDVPVSMVALSAGELASAGLNDISAVARSLPSLDLQSSVSATTTTLRIRRVGSLGNVTTFEPAVGFFVDGAFRSRSLLATSDFTDVERIEVLRGPQTTLYGKNVSAGVVSLYTKAPSEQLATNAEMSRGSIDVSGSPTLTKLKLGVSGPVTSTVRAGVAAVQSTHGATATNALAGGPDGNDENRLAMRGQVSWAPVEQFDLRLLVGYAREDDEQGESDVFLAPGTPSSRVADTLRQAGFSAECADNQPRNRISCSVATNKLDLESVDVTLLGRYELANGWTLATVTGWDRYRAVRNDDDIAQVSTPVLFFRDHEVGRSLQQELRLSGTSGVAEWLAGVFYYRHDYDRGMNGEQPLFGPNGTAAFDPIWPMLLRGLPLALPGQSGVHDSYLDTRYVSVFGNVTWRLAERLLLTTGLRWQRENKDAGIHNSVTAPGVSFISTRLTPSVSPSGEPVNGTLGRTSENVTWSITPQYRFSDDAMGYLTLASGSKSGGFNPGFGSLPLAAREFDDERVAHSELGLRSTFAQGRARLSTAAFYTEYHDYQDAAFVASQFSVGNAKKVRLRGIELDATARIATGLTADVAISVADLTYAKNTTGACFPGRVPDGTAPRSCNLSGEHPINAPVLATHVGLLYEHSLSWGGLYGRLDWSWTDQYNTTFSADPRRIQNDSSDVALRLGAQLGSSYEVVLWGDNLLGERVTHIDAALNLFDDASYQSFLAAPRSYGATVRLHF